MATQTVVRPVVSVADVKQEQVSAEETKRQAIACEVVRDWTIETWLNNIPEHKSTAELRRLLNNGFELQSKYDSQTAYMAVAVELAQRKMNRTSATSAISTWNRMLGDFCLLPKYSKETREFVEAQLLKTRDGKTGKAMHDLAIEYLADPDNK